MLHNYTYCQIVPYLIEQQEIRIGSKAAHPSRVSGLVVEYLPATEETRFRLPADAHSLFGFFLLFSSQEVPLYPWVGPELVENDWVVEKLCHVFVLVGSNAPSGPLISRGTSEEESFRAIDQFT